MENTENINKITTESIKNPSHVLSHVCHKSAFVCQCISATYSYIAVYKILQNLIEKFNIFRIGK